MRGSPLLHSIATWLTRFGATLAVAAQLGIAAAPIGEARDVQGNAPHVEVAGTSTHYAHNSATCATCQARSLNGLAVRTATPLASHMAHARLLPAAAERVPFAFRLSRNNPRAPPV